MGGIPADVHSGLIADAVCAWVLQPVPDREMTRRVVEFWRRRPDAVAVVLGRVPDHTRHGPILHGYEPHLVDAYREFLTTT